MQNATIIIEHRGDVESIDLGTFVSRRAAKRAVLGSELRRVLGRWPSRLSRAEAHIEIGGRRHAWLTSEIEDIARAQPTVGELLRSQGYAVV